MEDPRLPEGHPLLNALRDAGLATEAIIDGDFIMLVRPSEKTILRLRLSEATLHMLKTGRWEVGPIEFFPPQGEDRLEWIERQPDQA